MIRPSLDEAVHEHLHAKLLEAKEIRGGISSSGRRAKASESELWFCHHGTLVDLSFPESDHLRVQIPVTGAAVTKVGQIESIVTGTTGCISMAAANTRYQPDYCQFVWHVSQKIILKKLTALTGEPITANLKFNPEFDVSTAEGLLMKNLIGCFANATKLPGAHMLCSEIEQAMISILLDGPLRENTKLTGNTLPALAPYQIIKVEEYIEAHWDQALDYEVLALVSGASVRSLFRTFKTFRGYTPMDFAKKIRLTRARALLTDAGCSLSITAIAAQCGYSCLSVFSRDFAKAFGSSPSMVRHCGNPLIYG